MSKKYTKEEFEIAVKTSNSVREVLLKLEIAPEGGNYKTFYRAAKKFNVDVSAFINSTTYGIEKEKRSCINDVILSERVLKSTSYRQVLISFGLTESGTNYKWLKTKITKLKLDTSSFEGQGYLKGKNHTWGNKMPLDKALVKDSPYANSHSLKLRLIKEKVLENKCNRCFITVWQGEMLSLHLDHINGINNDNRIENLRLLCPNCHSLTETYCQKK